MLMVRPLWIYIFPQAGQEVTSETLFFSHFFLFPTVNIVYRYVCPAVKQNQLSIFEHILYSNTYLAFPEFIR